MLGKNLTFNLSTASLRIFRVKCDTTSVVILIQYSDLEAVNIKAL